MINIFMYSKTCVKRTLSKRPKIVFLDQLSLNADKKYCRMLPLEHSAILLTFTKLPFVSKIFVLSIFERPFYTGFTVCYLLPNFCCKHVHSIRVKNSVDLVQTASSDAS